MKNIILDTDLDTDCDDMGALALLYRLEREGKCRVLGIVCDAPVPAAAQCARAVNAFYGRRAVPVGSFEASAPERYREYFEHRRRTGEAGKLYNESAARGYRAEIAATPAPEKAVTLYRRLLAESEDGSVTVAAIGLLNVIAELLDSGPCPASPLTGRELLAAKVSELVVMAHGDYPAGRDRFNWRMDRCAAERVVNHVPVPLTVSPIGDAVFSGRRLMQCPSPHPVAEAYRQFLGPEALRPSWDPVVVLYSVCGTAGLFRLRRGSTIRFDAATGEHHWHDDSAGNRALLEPAVSPGELERRLEELMDY